MKKVLAVILAVLVASSCAVIAFAEGGSCPYCQQKFTTDAALSTHMEQCDYVQCAYCEKYFAPGTIGKHESSCEKNPANTDPEVACPYCNVKFAKSQLDAHKAACTSNPANAQTLDPIVCDTCGKTFYGVAAYNEHINSCTPASGEVIDCPYCNDKFDSLDAYNAHVEKYHYNFQNIITRHFDKYVFGGDFTSVPHVLGYFFDMFTTTGAFSILGEFASTAIAFFFECLGTLFQMNVVDA